MPSQEQVDNKVPHEIEMRPTNENPSKKPKDSTITNS